MKITKSPRLFACLAAASIFTALTGTALAQTNEPAINASTHARRPENLPANPKLPSLFLIGDSTVRNGSGRGDGGQWGWGDQIAIFFDTSKINVVNRALGGTTSRTFYRDLWPRLLALIKPGDFVIMQFGTNGGAVNDASRARGEIHGIGDDTQEITNLVTKKFEVVHTFGWYEKQMIADARSKGATPIVCSLIPRNNWKNGRAARSGSDTAAGWAADAAKSANAPFLDNNEIIGHLYDQLGQEKVNALFVPGQGPHTSLAGAQTNALCVISGLKGLKENPLTQFLSESATGITPADLSPPRPGPKFPPPTKLSRNDCMKNFIRTFSLRRSSNPTRAFHSLSPRRGEGQGEGEALLNTATSFKIFPLAACIFVLLSARTSLCAAEDERPVVDASKVTVEKINNNALPTFHIVGDSTVRSGGAGVGLWGWGECITPFFDTNKVNVINHAIGGRSARTFYNEGRWQKVVDVTKPGDIVIIQFGHNDQGRIGDPAMKGRADGKGIGDETVEDTKPDGTKELVHTFGWYMATFVKDAKAKGATVILCSPIPHKQRWESSRDFTTIADWDQQVAKNNGALYFDLTLVITAAYKKEGAEKVATYFADKGTHTTDTGAQFNAACVVAGLKSLNPDPLANFFSARGNEVTPYSPAAISTNAPANNP